MIATLRESKAKLSKLVALADSGEEVIITVRGRPKARLVAVKNLPQLKSWRAELENLQGAHSKTHEPKTSVVEDLREERF